VSLKAKLCILKNYTFLLLGPSSFEQWCESCYCFTVRPLSFLLFKAGSSVFLLESPSSSAFTAARACRLPPAAPERLHLLFPSSTRRLAVPSTARAFPAVLSSLCHVGPLEPSVCHKTKEVRRRRSPSCAQTRDLSPPLLLLSSSGAVLAL
jgi:hypothetical protein